MKVFKDRPRPGEIYAYRTLKPHLALVFARHFGYVGQTRNPAARHVEHVHGGGRYGQIAKPWSDLDPVRYVIWHSNSVRDWRLNLAEWAAIKILFPVYNHTMNLTNPRRITLSRAKAQRGARDAGIPRVPSWRQAAAVLILVMVAYGWWTR